MRFVAAILTILAAVSSTVFADYSPLPEPQATFYVIVEPQQIAELNEMHFSFLLDDDRLSLPLDPMQFVERYNSNLLCTGGAHRAFREQIARLARKIKLGPLLVEIGAFDTGLAVIYLQPFDVAADVGSYLNRFPDLQQLGAVDSTTLADQLRRQAIERRDEFRRRLQQTGAFVRLNDQLVVNETSRKSLADAVLSLEQRNFRLWLAVWLLTGLLVVGATLAWRRGALARAIRARMAGDHP